MSGSTSNHRAPYFCKASWGSDWLQQLPCKPVWIKYVKTYADCVAHAQDYRVESACCIWDRTNSPCQTKKERNSVWQTNGSFPASESDFWRRGCSGGLPGLLSSIHQPVHPPGKTGGTVYEGSSATLGLPPQDSKEMAALIKQEGMGGESACKGKKWTARSSLFHLYTLHLHSPRGPISLVCGFFLSPFRLVKFRPSRCFCCVHSWMKRCIKYLVRLAYNSTVFPLTPPHILGLLSQTEIQQVDIHNY